MTKLSEVLRINEVGEVDQQKRLKELNNKPTCSLTEDEKNEYEKLVSELIDSLPPEKRYDAFVETMKGLFKVMP